MREGFSRKEDLFPRSWFKPLQDGGKSPTLKDYYGRREPRREDLDRLLEDYYDEHGWRAAHGIPMESKVRELGLKEEAQRLRKDFTEPSGSGHLGKG